MARLNIEQVQGPNMSAAGNMLAQAGQSLDRGLDAASGLLTKYQEGQQATGDQNILAQMAQVKDENELAAFLSSPELADANLSEDMRKSVLGLRDNVIGYGQGRADVRQTDAQTGLIGANTRNVDARTQIANAAEGRTQTDWTYDNRRRDEQTALAGEYAYALAEGQQYGNGGAFSRAIDNTESGGAADQYDTLFGYRNRSNGVRVSNMTLGEAKAFSDLKGEYAQSVENEIGRLATPMGKYQIVGTTLRAVQDSLGLPDDVKFNPEVQELMGTYLGQQRVQSGSQESMRNGLRAEWEGFKNKSDSELDVIIAELQATPMITRDQIIAASSGQVTNTSQTPVTQNGGQSPAAQALMGAMASGSTFTMADVDAAFKGLNGATDRGQAQIDAAEAQRVSNLSAEGILAAARNPNILNASGVGNTAANTPGLSPSQQLETAVLGVELGAGALNGIVAPGVAEDPLLTAQAASDDRVRQREIDALPQTSLIKTSERYEGDAVGGLIADLGLGEDGEDNQKYVFGLFGGEDDNKLRMHIKDIAARAGVTEEMAAAGMADQFKRDPWGPNTQNARFDPDKTVAYLQETVSPAGMRAYEDALIRSDVSTARTQASAFEISTLNQQLAKVTDPRRRQQLQAQINQAKDQALANATPQQAQEFFRSWMRENASSGRLRGLDPRSADYARAIGDIQTEIERDDSLTDREKSLLISQLPG